MSLGKKSIGAFFWASSQQIAVLVINLAVSIWLARILDPYEFGLIGMIAVFVSVGTVLMNGGLSSSLIRTKNPTQTEFSTVFYTNICFSFVVYGIIYLCAPYIASFFEKPLLTDIVRVYSLTIVVSSFSSVQLAKLTKELRFKKAMSIRLPSLILGGLVGIYMAYSLYGVWSLVSMYLIQALGNSVQLWFRSGWKPTLNFSISDLKHHYGFGFKLVLSGFLDAIYQNIYNLVIGKYYNAQMLGYYTRSYTLVAIPVFNLQEILDKVSYPLLSEIQDDNKKLKSTYKNIFQSILFIILPILLIGIIIAEPLFRFVLTEKWLPAVPYFQLICVAGIFIPLSKNNLNILKVKGKSGLYLKLGVIEKLLISGGLIFILPFGIYGLLYFQIFASIGAFLLNGWYSGKLINYLLKEQLVDFFKVFMIALASSAITWVVFNFLVDTIHDSYTILLSSLVFVTIYGILIYFIHKSIINNLRNLLLKK